MEGFGRARFQVAKVLKRKVAMRLRRFRAEGLHCGQVSCKVSGGQGFRKRKAVLRFPRFRLILRFRAILRFLSFGEVSGSESFEAKVLKILVF